ncbi:MAG: histidine kinase [Pseudomonadales bacterium]
MNDQQQQNNFKFFFTAFIIIAFIALNGALYDSHNRYSTLFITAQNACSEAIQTLVAPHALNTPQKIVSSHQKLQSSIKELNELNLLGTPHKNIHRFWSDKVSPYLLATLNNINEREDDPALLLITRLQSNLHAAYKKSFNKTLRLGGLISSILLALLLVMLVYLYISRHLGGSDNQLSSPSTDLADTVGTNSTNSYQLPEDTTLLHRTLPKLIENPDSLEPLKTLLSEIEKTVDASSSAVFLYDKNNNLPNLLVCTFIKEQELYISSADNFPNNFINLELQSHPIYMATYYGNYKVLAIQLPYDSENNANALLLLKIDSNTKLNEEQARLLRDHSELLASMIHISQFFNQKLRNVQYEERSAIARELHDSIAQSLSYLKIQASRLQSMINNNKKLNDHSMVQIDLAVQELRESISIAYRHLRELLTTFRLTMDGKSFACAIEDSIKEFEKRCSIVFELDNRLPDGELSVAEEMQLLHIMREALSNVVRHSHAQYTRITLLGDSNGMINMSIEDDGIGLISAGDHENHHGVIIMQERTRSIGGTLKLEEREESGTRVNISFPNIKHAKANS